MASLLTTVWLVLAAMAYAAILEHAGFLERLLRPIVDAGRAGAGSSSLRSTPARSRSMSLLVTSMSPMSSPAACSATSSAAEASPQVSHRAVEDSGTVTSALIPWNTCGAYMSGVLGVSTAAYFPFCFFNLLSPVLDVIYGFVGFKVVKLPPPPTPTSQTERTRHPRASEP